MTDGRSERGVVFFRDSEITPEEQKDLVQALGLLGGKPKEHGLHVHPLTLAGSELGDEISVISNKFVFYDKFKRDDFTVLDRVAHKLLWVSSRFRHSRLRVMLMTSTRISHSSPPHPTMPRWSSVRSRPSGVIPSGHRLMKPMTVSRQPTRNSSRD